MPKEELSIYKKKRQEQVNKLVETTAKEVLGKNYKQKISDLAKKEKEAIELRRLKKRKDIQRLKKSLKKAEESGNLKQYEKLLKEKFQKYHSKLIET